MERTTYASIRANLDEVLGLCGRLSLNTQVEGSRFVGYRAILDRLIENLDRRAASNDDTMRIGVALVESAELADLLPYLVTVSPDVLTPKLREILRGPFLPVDEDQNSNQARNVMFELTLASKLWGAGLAPEIGEHPDLRCEIEGRLLLIECKRALSERGLPGLIQRADHQLRRHSTGVTAASHGIVALSVSRIVNEGDKVLAFSDERRASEKLSGDLERLANEASITLRSGGSNQIVGAVFNIVTPARQREDGLIVRVDETLLMPLATPGSTEDRAFRAFGKAIRSIADQR